jgi:type I restriction enzyme S subunit
VGVGKLAVSPIELCTSQDFCNFTATTGDVRFLAYLLKKNKNSLLSLCQGTSIKGLSSVELRSLKVQLPQPDEQQKIADVLSALDAKIDAMAGQIEKLETFKKGLLQQMFV